MKLLRKLYIYDGVIHYQMEQQEVTSGGDQEDEVEIGLERWPGTDYIGYNRTK